MIPAKIWATDAHGQADYFNQRWKEFTGQDLTSALSEGWIESIYPEDRPNTLERWMHSVRTGEEFELEYRLRHRSGAYRWTFSRAQPARDESGRVVRWYGSTVDINRTKLAEQRVAQSEERHRALIEALTNAIWVAGPDGYITDGWRWNMLTDGAGQTFFGPDWLQKIHPDDRLPALERWRRSQHEQSLYEAEFRIKSGPDYQWLSVRAVPLKNADGTLREWVGTASDIHDNKIAAEEIRLRERRWRLALQAGRMTPWEFDPERSILEHQHTSADELELTSGRIAAFLERVVPEDQQAFLRFLGDLRQCGEAAIEYRIHSSGTDAVWLSSRGQKLESGEIIGVSFDISDQKQAEAKVWEAANLDPLTRLANRRLFASRAEEILEEARRNGVSIANFLLDLDHFKGINDTLGHDVGDAFLTEVGRRLRELNKETKLAARLSGDEFALLAPCPCPQSATRLAEKILVCLSAPFTHSNHTFSGAGSIGISIYPEHGSSPSELLKCADIALYDAKSKGRMQAVMFNQQLGDVVAQRSRLLDEVRAALAQGCQFVPYYQAKHCAKSRRITGFEVLTRWKHPSLGILSPAYFGAVFDDQRLGVDLSKYILRSVMRDMEVWSDAGVNPGQIAFNITSGAFLRPGLCNYILDILDQSCVPPDHFEIEVVENAFLGRDSNGALETLMRFKDRGISIALDDFGTGFASLIHLRRFPISHVKIDASFVANIERSDEDVAVVSGMIDLCHRLKMKVTAEGVETEGQLRLLKNAGCDFLQGYFLSEPIAACDVPALLSRWNRNEEAM